MRRSARDLCGGGFDLDPFFVAALHPTSASHVYCLMGPTQLAHPSLVNSLYLQAMRVFAQIQPCSSTVCTYVGYWPAAPAPGSYTNIADVQYSVGTSGIMGNQAGTAIFQVTPLPDAVGMMNTAAGAIPAGQAIVQDGMAPQAYQFSGESMAE